MVPVLVLVETGETGQVSGEGDLASKPTAGAAKAAGCPTKTHHRTIKSEKSHLITEYIYS